ncbi:uncharacterized protein [Antennarius striatus]|uniref:uncharacterized protein n=1 Tax=Antennarius striatus TaxID=241820 RepID=UPI0035B15084
MYGGMNSFPFGSQLLGTGAEQPSTKYGIGGLQFGGQPLSTGINGAGHNGYGRNHYGPAGDGKSSGKYGHGGFPNGGQLLGLGTIGNIAGRYGYGRMPYKPQPAGLSPESTHKYGMTGSPYQPESHGFGQNGQLTHDTAAHHESLPTQTDSAGKPYVNGEIPTPAVEGEGMPVGGFDVGYINGQVQPEAAPSSPTLDDPSAPSYLPVETSFTPDAGPGGVEDLPDPMGTASLSVDSTAAPALTEGGVEVHEQPDDPQQQLPRQIHIQQHLKLHFHPQGSKNGKHDLNGFFGNSDYQG